MNMVCFDPVTLRDIFEQPSRAQLLEDLFLSDFNPVELVWSEEKMREIANTQNLLKDKEDVEIFTAAYMMQTFFPEKSKVCFLMKDGFNPKADRIDSLEPLKSNIKENHDVDFGLLYDKDLRFFQLKSYRGKSTSQEFLSFLKGKIAHYAYNLGTTNLLITLQSSGELDGDFFHNIHDEVKTLNIKGIGEILITYNEENKFDVMNTVYPILNTVRVPYKRLSERLI